MHRLCTLSTVAVLLLAVATAARAEDVDVCPGNIGSDSITLTNPGAWQQTGAWMNPTGYDFASNRYSLDLTTYNGGDPVALQGFVDLTGAPLPDETDAYTEFYGQWVIRDANDYFIQTTFGTDNLGAWHGCPPQPADRIRLENYDAFYDTAPSGNDYCQPEEYYLTEGGTHDMGGGGTVYPTDRQYYAQIVIDPDPAGTSVTLEVWGKGNAGLLPPPDSNNCVDYKQWYRINDDPDYSSGPIVFDPMDFDFSQVEIYGWLMASDQVEGDETITFEWMCANLGTPLTFDQTPVPEPATLGLVALGGWALLRRRRR